MQKAKRKIKNMILEAVTVAAAAVYASTMFSLSTASIGWAVAYLVSMAWLLFFSYANMFREKRGEKA